jgi:hypothetical protein
MKAGKEARAGKEAKAARAEPPSSQAMGPSPLRTSTALSFMRIANNDSLWPAVFEPSAASLA